MAKGEAPGSGSTWGEGLWETWGGGGVGYRGSTARKPGLPLPQPEELGVSGHLLLL